MKHNRSLLGFAVLMMTTFVFGAQSEPAPEPATKAVWEAFRSHDIVMLGEMHRNEQEYEWLRSLVANLNFADRVNDIVMEFGNSLYQESVDRYVSGDDISTRAGPGERGVTQWLR
jgi:hypothetical protein